MKINLITVSVVTAILAFGAVYLISKEVKTAPAPSYAVPSSAKPKALSSDYTALEPVATITDKIYTNQKYGFSLTMPAAWSKYTVQEYRLANGSTVIKFGLPLETDQITRWLSAEEQINSNFEVWSFHIMDAKTWQNEQDLCKDADSPCFPPIELARNDSYVYGIGQFFTASGWDPCSTVEDKDSEPYFCKVYRHILPENGYSVEKSFKLL